MHVHRPGNSHSNPQSSGTGFTMKPLEHASSQSKRLDPPRPLRRSVSLTGVGPYVYKKKESPFIEPEVKLQPNLNKRGSLLFSLIRSKSMGKKNDNSPVGMHQKNTSTTSFWKSKNNSGELSNDAEARQRDVSPSGAAKLFRSRSFLQKKRNFGVELPSEVEVPETPSVHRRIKSQSSTPNLKKDGNGVLLNSKKLIKGLFMKDVPEEHMRRGSVPLSPNEYESTDESYENYQLPDPRRLLSKSTFPITWTSESGTLYSSDGIESMTKQENNWKGPVSPTNSSVTPEGSLRSLSPTSDYPTNRSKHSMDSESQETLTPGGIRFTPHGSHISLNSMVNDVSKTNFSPPKILKSPLLVLSELTEISGNSAFPQPTPLRTPKRTNSQLSTAKHETDNTHRSPLRFDVGTDEALTDVDTLGRVSRLSVQEVIDWHRVNVESGTDNDGEEGTIGVVDGWYDAAKDLGALDDVWYTPPDFLSMPRRRVVSTLLDGNSSVAKEKLDVLLESITVFDEYFAATEKN
ncbi:hypothetical protein HK096_006518 [Nowakowskiella sp. JEL0078]|nr:hypothetical protein HK096_006518 [Nowakowskiella sp. JEL0078]